MALFRLNEDYGYDEVTAFLESLEYDVEQAALSEAKLSEGFLSDIKKRADQKVNTKKI